MRRDETIVIGEIVGVHGVKGMVKVRSFAESPEIFASDSQMWLNSAGGELAACRILRVQSHRRGLLMEVAGVSDRDGAEALVGRTLHVAKDALPSLEADTYYRFELIGLDVYSDTDDYVGRIEAVMETGSNDVLVVRDPAAGSPSADRLIPALASVVLAVDLKAGRMWVKLPEGL